MKYQIVKKKKEAMYELLSYPLIKGDFIYEFDSLDEAKEKLKELLNMGIYQDITLSIIEVDY